VNVQDLVATLNTLLERSRATSEFSQAVLKVASVDGPNELIQFDRWLPAVKVLRVIAQLLETEPELEIRKVAIDARAGCSNFTGTINVNDGERSWRFDWDCRWRAEQEGWYTPSGAPDQVRAAHEFGYRCFRVFEPLAPSAQ
jgi:hypothetical protein